MWWSNLVAAGLSCATVLLSGPSRAAADIRVDLTTQTMRVVAGDGETHVWPVSTARAGFVTPRGSFSVQSLQPIHFSRKYHNSPMPHSIFFRGGYAIHGTYSTASLGRTASHGCIRLAPGNAATLFHMVQYEGARITITGRAPSRTMMAREERQPDVRAANRRARRWSAEPFDDAPLISDFDDWADDPAAPE